MAINGVGIVIALAGSALVVSSVKGNSIGKTVRGYINGTPEAVASSGDITPAVGEHGGSGTQNQSIGRLLASPYGWSVGAEWTALDNLWSRESEWDNLAKNPGSGAYGIPQALPESKLPTAGQSSGGSSAAAQIAWGLQYIQSRYGSPSAAWAHETSNGWY